MKVIIQKPDLDTCLAGLILRVGKDDDISVLAGNAPEEYISNPQVICIEAGGSGKTDLNNFDHHDTEEKLSPACRQAFMMRKIDAPEMKRLVEYVCMVDEIPPPNRPKIPFPSLSNIFSGMLFSVKDARGQFLNGLEILQAVLDMKIDPFATMPDIPEWRIYREAKDKNIAVLATDLINAEYFTSDSGRKLAYLESNSIGGIGSLYANGCEAVILFSPAYGNPPVTKYTIAGNNLNVYNLLESFLILEPGWGGRETIIGSPRSGTNLKKEEVLRILKEDLI